MYAKRLNTSFRMNIEPNKTFLKPHIHWDVHVVRGTDTTEGQTLQVKKWKTISSSPAQAIMPTIIAVLFYYPPTQDLSTEDIFMIDTCLSSATASGGRTLQVFGDITYTIFRHALKRVTLVC